MADRDANLFNDDQGVFKIIARHERDHARELQALHDGASA